MGQRGVLTGFTTMGHMLTVIFKKAFSKFPLAQFTAEVNSKDLEMLASLMQQKKIIAVIERTYSYKKIPEAISYIEVGHTKGKVAMIWENFDDAIII